MESHIDDIKSRNDGMKVTIKTSKVKIIRQKAEKPKSFARSHNNDTDITILRKKVLKKETKVKMIA